MINKATKDDVDNVVDRQIDELIKVKRKITSALDRTILVSILREIVEKCECLDFLSPRAAKFINGDRPLLSLVFNEDKLAEKYPTQLNVMRSSKDIDEQHSVRRLIVQEEINREILNFFNLVMMKICKRNLDDLPEELSRQLPRVEKVLDGHDVEKLSELVTNTLKSMKEEGASNSIASGYLFSIVSAISFPEGEEVFTRDNIYVEISY